jgi:tetratricopeptide (TPR) repeat protein
MSEGRGHDLAAIRDQLLEQFAANPEAFRRLFFTTQRRDLRPLRTKIHPRESLEAQVEIALGYGQRQLILGELLAEAAECEPGEHPDARPVTVSPFNLPPSLGDFTGRRAEIQEIREHLAAEAGGAVLTVHGMGGMGKTALAVHVARQLATEGCFGDAQLYVDLKGAGDNPLESTQALGALLTLLLGPDPLRPTDLAALTSQWRAALHGKDVLLFLDNAASAAQVRPLLSGSSGCSVWVTSRQRFALPGARRLELRRMGIGSARELLLTLAPHLEGSGAEAMADLCGGLPLALRVAGNYLAINDDVPPEEYAASLNDQRKRLAQLRDPDDPDLDVEAAIALSVGQLAPEARRAWALVSLFAAPFEARAAGALWDLSDGAEVRRRLQALRNRSLLEFDADVRRYRQHDLVRLAARRELASLGEGEVEAAELGYVQDSLSVLEEAGRLYAQGGEHLLQGLALWDAERAHIEPGLVWAATRAEDDDVAARLCSDYARAASGLLPLRLRPRHRLAWSNWAVAAADRLGDKEAEAHHRADLVDALADLGNWTKVFTLGVRLLTAATASGDPIALARARCNHGRFWLHRAEAARASVEYEAALALARQAGHASAEARALNGLGQADAARGELEDAVAHHEQARALSHRAGDLPVLATTLGYLGRRYETLGELQRAAEAHQEGLAIARRLEDRRGEAAALGRLGRALAQMGQVERAIECHEAARDLARELGDRLAEEGALSDLGQAHYEAGRLEKAVELLMQAHDQRRGRPVTELSDRSEIDRRLARAYRRLGNDSMARHYFRGFVTGLGSPQAREAFARAVWARGRRQRSSDPGRARDNLEEARLLLEDLGDERAEQVRRELEALGGRPPEEG